MKRTLLPAFLAGLLALTASGRLPAIEIHDYPELERFIEYMAKKHDFERGQLRSWFESASIQPSIIEAMERPKEALPWYKYKEQFVTDDHARRGARFWREHQAAFRKAEDKYGVPPEIILAILGIETQYGRATGSFSIIDALSTLTLEYPPRSAFFRTQLEEYLLLTRELGVDPLSLKGSYAGAIGLPQFIPSSYRSYAIDFDGDNKADLLTSASDAIGSVANYFSVHGWQPGAPIIDSPQIEGPNYVWFVSLGIKPQLKIKHLASYGVFPSRYSDPDLNAALLRLDEEAGPLYLLGYDNFYTITRYNHSTNYAMAVVELSRRIRAEHLNQ